jgi:hypothetical protein
VRWLQVHPQCRDDHVVAYSGIELMVENQAGYAVVAGVERLPWIFAEDRAKGIDERFPDVGPVPAGASNFTCGIGSTVS